MSLGPTGTHNSRDSYVTATPPPPIPQSFDPGYIKPARTLQFGPQGSTSPGQGQNWPDSFQRP
jgi:hypothetical protein